MLIVGSATEPHPPSMVKAQLNISTVSTREGFQALREPWNRLLGESPSNNYFLRWEWLWSWWEAYGPSLGSLQIVLAKRGERIVGIGPFYRTRAMIRGIVPIRRLLFLGTAN